MVSHEYRATVRWTGNAGTGTSAYTAYDRHHTIVGPGKPAIPGTSSLGPRGDPTRYNPDELLVAALSACHMLWYLHLCSEASVVVEEYVDEAVGILETVRETGGHFSSATLRPRVTISAGSETRALELHAAAHAKCFIANSVNFPVRCEPTVVLRGPPEGHLP